MKVKTAAMYQAMGRADAKSIRRDSLLRWALIMAPMFALITRFILPAATELFKQRFGFDLTPYHTLIISALTLTTPGLVGTVIGFLLLDQRDEAILPAILVTPVRLSDYLTYRLAVPTLIAAILTAISLPLAGNVPMTGQQILASCLCSSMLAAFYAVFLGAIAANKVQGFAVSKSLGILIFPAAAGYFFDGPWSYLCGLSPHYWPMKTFWLFAEGDTLGGWCTAIAGIGYQALLVWLLSQRLATVLRR